MALAPIDFLARIDAAYPGLVSHLDALAIEDRGRGHNLTPTLIAYHFSQDVMDLQPKSLLSPLAEIVIHRWPGGQVLGQHPPGATAPDNAKMESTIRRRGCLIGRPPSLGFGR